MNTEMSYLLGMITGNGEIQRGPTTTTISIDIPHKKLETEFQKDVGIYVKASITDIRQILEPLLGTSLKFIQNPNISILSFTKPNEDYLMREIIPGPFGIIRRRLPVGGLLPGECIRHS